MTPVPRAYVATKPLEAAPRGSLLSHLDIELTERCNIACLHCYINKPAQDRAAQAREMSTAQVTGILDEAAALGCRTVRVTGGEPLLREDWEALYLHARRLGLTVTLCTNATLLTPHLADLFARIPPLERIEITVYGMTRASYDAVTRAPGSFEACRRGMGLLLERRVPFLVKSVLLPPNQDELAAFEAFAASLPWTDHPPGSTLSLNLRARRDSDAKNRRIRELRMAPEAGVAVLARHGERYLKEMRAFCARFTRPEGDTLFACGAGQANGSVDAYGRFQMCLLLRDPALTVDLGKTTLRAALTEVFPRRRESRAAHPDYLARCARCFLKGLCDQCPAKSWMEHGTLDTPVEYECAVAHAKARHLGLLADGEQAWDVQDWRERIARFVGA